MIFKWKALILEYRDIIKKKIKPSEDGLCNLNLGGLDDGSDDSFPILFSAALFNSDED